MLCETCGKEIEGEWRKYPRGPLRYCSKACANSRKHTPETKLKIRLALKSSDIKKYEVCQECGKPTERNRHKLCLSCYQKTHGVDRIVEALKQGNNVFNMKASPLTIRKALILLKSYKCERCGISEYNQEPLSLQIDHIDGDSTNDTLVNLRFLCPNCHSQTPTYGARNRGKSTRDWHVVSKKAK